MAATLPTTAYLRTDDGARSGMKAARRRHVGLRLWQTVSLPRIEMDERVEWASKKAALWTEVKDKLRQSGSGLSRGQQQRLYIARGIAIRAEVLLLDELCSALDPISTGKIEE